MPSRASAGNTVNRVLAAWIPGSSQSTFSCSTGVAPFPGPGGLTLRLNQRLELPQLKAEPAPLPVGLLLLYEPQPKLAQPCTVLIVRIQEVEVENREVQVTGRLFPRQATLRSLLIFLYIIP